MSIRSRIGLVILFLGAALSCNSNKTSPSGFKCPVGLSLKPPALTSIGGSGIVAVTAQANCGWDVTTDASWITGLTPTSGQGNGEVQFQASANPTAASRQGNIILNSVRLNVAQPGVCPVTLTPTKQDVPAANSNATVSVTAAADCGWNTASSAPWITVTSGANGMGNGTVGFSVADNTGPQRIGTIAIGDQTFTVTQADVNAPVCNFTIVPAFAAVNPAGGSVPVTVQAGPTCSWTAKSNATWLTLTDLDSGTGSGSVMISVAANTGAARNGTVTIAGLTFTVTQAGSIH